MEMLNNSEGLTKTNQTKVCSQTRTGRSKQEVPQIKCKTYGDTTFGVYAAKTWNELPDKIRKLGTICNSERKSKHIC